MDESAQRMLHLDAGLGNGAIFTSSLLALWCCGNAALWGCHHSLCSSKKIGQAFPTALIPKNLPSKMGCGPHPANNAVPCPQCQVTPICICSGPLCPFSGTELVCCLPQGWHFLGANRASCPQSCLQPWASRAARSSAGRAASPTCCSAVCWSWLGQRGLWGHGQHPIQSRCRRGCCLLLPATKLQARGEDCELIPGCSGPQLSDAGWGSSSLMW